MTRTRLRIIVVTLGTLLAGLPRPAAAQIPVTDAGAIYRLYLEYLQFKQYYDTYLYEISGIQHLGQYGAKYQLYWLLNLGRDTYGRSTSLVQALNSGLNARGAYGGATANRLVPPPDLGVDQGEQSDSATLVDLYDSEAEDAVEAAGTYREQSGILDDHLGLMESELTANLQSEKAVLDRVQANTVLVNQQLRDTNRLLASSLILQALENADERNTQTYLSNGAIFRKLNIDQALSFMDSPQVTPN
jgi:hypothetical protein